jgi:hypothetical protein
MAQLRRFTVILRKDVKLISRRPSDLVLLILLPVVTSLPSSYTSPTLGLVLTSIMISVQLGFMGTIREEDLGVLDGMRIAPTPFPLHHLSRIVVNSALLTMGISVYVALLLVLNSRIPLDPLVASSIVIFFSSTSSLASGIVVYAGSRSPLSVLINAVFSLGFSLYLVTNYPDCSLLYTSLTIFAASMLLSAYLK